MKLGKLGNGLTRFCSGSLLRPGTPGIAQCTRKSEGQRTSVLSDSDSSRQTAPTSRVLPVRLPPPALRLVIPLHYILYHSSAAHAAPRVPLWLILAVTVGDLIQEARLCAYSPLPKNN